MDKRANKIEFGDFQTPYDLAVECCKAIQALTPEPSSIFEPTCGFGNFLAAGRAAFKNTSNFLGLEINPSYAATAKARFEQDTNVEIRQGDFFSGQWKEQVAALSKPILIVGNPPWVTNATLGSLISRNVPEKRNMDSLSGMDARTGKSNFDISEWILIEACRLLNKQSGTIAVLCKTSVARKVLERVWRESMTVASANILPIDSKAHFQVAVSACLFILNFTTQGGAKVAAVRKSIHEHTIMQTIGFADDRIVAEPAAYEAGRHMAVAGGLKWRSGIKHDAAEIMEVECIGGYYRNGLGQEIDIEKDMLFPMYKSSDIHHGRLEARRFLIVPQTSTASLTSELRLSAPLTWAYLKSHSDRLASRKSSIYRNRPEFAIFGVGAYTFKPWKVAISGLYKGLNFRIIGPAGGKPVVFDDTVYFLSFDTEEDAQAALTYLLSKDVIAFLGSQVFWDAKRPITAELLNRLHIADPVSKKDVARDIDQGNLFAETAA